MKTLNNNMLKQLVHQLDLMNTINGGVSITTVDVIDFENRTELKISAAGVHPESFNIFIANNQLMVFSVVPEHEQDNSLPITIPLFSKTWTLPPYVDEEKIEAVQEGNVLRIILPFKNNSKINMRKIDIKSIY